MPYIREPRDEIEEFVGGNLKNGVPDDLSVLEVGELNYIITLILSRWLGKDARYADINAAMGVLACAQQELYRRIAAPYEDKKCKENGDVYVQTGT